MKVSIPGMETVRSDHFLCLEKVSFSLVSAQKDCLTSLCCLNSLRFLPLLRSGRQLLWSVRQLLRSVRQLSFFVTTVESETFSRHKNRSTFLFSPWDRPCLAVGTIIPRFPFFYLVTWEKLKSDVEYFRCDMEKNQNKILIFH